MREGGSNLYKSEVPSSKTSRTASDPPTFSHDIAGLTSSGPTLSIQKLRGNGAATLPRPVVGSPTTQDKRGTKNGDACSIRLFFLIFSATTRKICGKLHHHLHILWCRALPPRCDSAQWERPICNPNVHSLDWSNRSVKESLPLWWSLNLMFVNVLDSDFGALCSFIFARLPGTLLQSRS